MARKRNRQRLTVVHPDAAAVDIGGKFHMVAINPERSEQPTQRFDAYTDELERMARWLHEHGVTVVAMEATGVYWIPVYEVLDRAGFAVQLVNPRACKQVSGRKSDVLDCEWTRQLMSYGLLRGAFRPADEWCVLRAFVRQHARLVKDQQRTVQHIHKALTLMNLQLAQVLSDITGKTGMAILRAIVAGERDGMKLAGYRDPRVRADTKAIARALTGTWRDEHLFALAQALEAYDFFERQIQATEQRIGSTLADISPAPAAPLPAVHVKRSSSGHRDQLRDRHLRLALQQALGCDLTAIPTIGTDTALVVAAEIGRDLSRFPDCEHFCSWITLSPGTRISGGKTLPGRPPKTLNRAGEALKLAALNARYSKTFIGASHRGRLARMDKAPAIKATAHQLARLIYLMITRGQPYVERGIETYELDRRDRQLHAIQRRARALGLVLCPSEDLPTRPKAA